MDDLAFIQECLKKYRQALFETDVSKEMIAMRDLLVRTKESRGKMILAGNGASAAIAAHAAIDFTKQAGIRAICFNEPSLITAFSNDCGYEHWIRQALEFYSQPEDVIVLISSSGRSPNIVNAARYARSVDNPLVTFTGFSRENPVKSLGDINFWVDSKAYNIIENTHSIWLMMVCDLFIGKLKYSVSQG
jgi:D-sedoheptulose 7-phosphate isomerase